MRFQGVELAFETGHFRDAAGAKVEHGAGPFGDHICSGTALDDVSIYSGATTRIIPFQNARHLEAELVYGVYAFFRSQTCVRGSAMNSNFCFAYTFACGFYQAAWPVRGLKDENRIAAARFGFDEFPGRIAADFFVGGPKKNDAFVRGEVELLKRVVGEEGLHDSGLHIEGARSVGFAGGEPERHFF